MALGAPKSVMTSVKTTKQALTSPNFTPGRVTVTKVLSGEAPRVRAASPFVARFVGQMNFIPATACERAGWARVGSVELRHLPGPAMAAGPPLTLAIRPEEILVGSAARNGENGLLTRIRAVQFLGSFTRLTLVLAGDSGAALECDVAANAFAELGAAEGAELRLGLRPDALRVFVAAG